MDTPLTAYILKRLKDINWKYPSDSISIPRNLLEDDHIENVAELESLLKYIRAVKGLTFRVKEINYCIGEETFIIKFR
jgi:hypothetical protein